jgi:hypothetical protein
VFSRAAPVRSLLLVVALAALLALGALTASVFRAPSAGAADAKPAPCDGKPLTTDKAGDVFGSVPTESANLDIKAGFFAYDADGQLSVNIVIDDLKGGPDAGFANTVQGRFSFGGKNYTFRVFLYNPSLPVGGEIYTYKDGTEGPNDTGKNTTGRTFKGKDGLVSINIPEDVVPSGSVLKSVVFETVNENDVTDRAPDSGTLETKVAPCGGGATTGSTSATTGPGPEPGGTLTQPPSTGGSSTTDTAPATTSTTTTGGRQQRNAKLAIRFSRFGGSARAYAKAKVLKLKVRATSPIKGLTAQLRFGGAAGPVVGTGKLASLKGNGTLAITLKKKLRKGTYLVLVLGRDAKGRRGGAAARITLK